MLGDKAAALKRCLRVADRPADNSQQIRSIFLFDTRNQLWLLLIIDDPFCACSTSGHITSRHGCHSQTPTVKPAPAISLRKHLGDRLAPAAGLEGPAHGLAVVDGNQQFPGNKVIFLAWPPASLVFSTLTGEKLNLA